jgi:predicted Zn-dependent peptidase
MTALEELYGAGYESVYKFDSKIKAVTKDDLKRILHKYFPLDGYTEVIITGID